MLVRWSSGIKYDLAVRAHRAAFLSLNFLHVFVSRVTGPYITQDYYQETQYVNAKTRYQISFSVANFQHLYQAEMGVDYVLKIKVTKEEWSVQKKTDNPNGIVDVDDFSLIDVKMIR